MKNILIPDYQRNDTPSVVTIPIRIYTFLFFILVSLPQNGLAASNTDSWRVLEKAETLDVYMQDKPAGTLIHTFSVLDSSILVATSFALQGENHAAVKLALLEKRLYGLTGSLLFASQTLRSESGASLWNLKKNDSGWSVMITTGGEEKKVPVHEVFDNLGPTQKIYTSIKDKTCRYGDMFVDTVFELVSQKNIVSTYKYIDQNRDGSYVFEVTDNMAHRPQKWEIDGQGFTVMQEIEGVFIAKKRTANSAQVFAAQSSGVDLSKIFSVTAPEGRLAADNEQILVTFANGLDLDSTVRNLYCKKGIGFVLNKVSQTCSMDSLIHKPLNSIDYTKPTTTIQSDNPEIKKRALDCIGTQKDVCSRIAACNSYVFSFLEKRNTATFSNAIETLHAGFGDCGEHAVLLAAFLRSLGIPCRVVLGLIYNPVGKAYFGHAWVIVYCGKEWVYADPAFGEFPASLNRIPLCMDESGTQGIVLINYIGRISLDYIKNVAENKR